MPDISKIIQEVLFEWDGQKDLANIRKHGVSLEGACEAFFDPFLFVVDEEEFIDDELREKVIAMTPDWRLLYIVYVMRNDRIRLISAREATNAERECYETQ